MPRLPIRRGGRRAAGGGRRGRRWRQPRLACALRAWRRPQWPRRSYLYVCGGARAAAPPASGGGGKRRWRLSAPRVLAVRLCASEAAPVRLCRVRNTVKCDDCHHVCSVCVCACVRVYFLLLLLFSCVFYQYSLVRRNVTSLPPLERRRVAAAALPRHHTQAHG